MRDYTAIAEKLIKNSRWWRVRLKVRGALERAYEDGLNDATAEIRATNDEAVERIHELAKRRSDRPNLPPPASRLSH